MVYVHSPALFLGETWLDREQRYLCKIANIDKREMHRLTEAKAIQNSLDNIEAGVAQLRFRKVSDKI